MAVTNLKNKILAAILILLIVLFAGSLFKNIAYPLLWNDEAETVMFATRVLEYGYPKVHDGKNVLCLLRLPIEFGVKEKIDAYIGSFWGQYYFSAIGAFLAEKVDGIYAKTSLLRIPFALMGFAGLVIMALSTLNLWEKNLTAKLLFLICFVFLELLSIPLLLHLRQVRHPPLTIFLSACIFYAYINHRFLGRINPKIYMLVMTLLLVLLFNIFPPVYFVFIITIGLYECMKFLKRTQGNSFVMGILPLLFSLIAVIPLLMFFETFRISGEFAKVFNINYSVQCAHILRTITFFQKFEFLRLVLVVKIVLIILWFYLRNLKIFPSPVKENEAIAKKCLQKSHNSTNNESGAKTEQKLWVSSFLSLFFLIYIFVITKIPLPFVFQRYFIALQPVLIIILLLDIFVIFELISLVNSLTIKIGIRTIVLSLVFTLFIFNGLNKIEHIKNHTYELFHQYRGPLDFVIPYIKSNYRSPESLVIATNYEECAYMYYLRSKVIIGFVGNNLKEDLKMSPDTIIFRKKWNYNPQIFSGFFQNERYKKVSFPVFDYPVNNIPELDGGVFRHLYRTRLAKNEGDRLDIYIKQ